MSKSLKIIHIVDFANKNLWFEEYLDLIAAQGVRQEVLMLSENEHLVNYAKSKNINVRGSFEFLITSFFSFTRRDKSSFALAHGYIPSIFASAMYPLHRVKPIIVHHHQPNFFNLYRSKSFLKGTLHGLVLRLTYKMSFAIQSFSEEVRESLIRKGVPKKKIFSNPIGVNLSALKEFLKPESSVDHLTNFEKSVVSISRLSWEKNLALGIKAVAKANQGGSRLRYRIYGEGPERSALEALIVDLNAHEYIELKGFDTEIFHALSSSNLFLHTSQTESYGQVILEAFSIGVPILTTKVGVAIDLYNVDSSHVQFIETDEPSVIANQIYLQLQQCPIDKEVLSNASILEHHSIERSVLRLVNFLESAL
jgi:glycosyltransferase involved in cell wall biosynthesis